jgi:hypothetical protein
MTFILRSGDPIPKVLEIVGDVAVEDTDFLIDVLKQFAVDVWNGKSFPVHVEIRKDTPVGAAPS